MITCLSDDIYIALFQQHVTENKLIGSISWTGWLQTWLSTGSGQCHSVTSPSSLPRSPSFLLGLLAPSPSLCLFLSPCLFVYVLLCPYAVFLLHSVSGGFKKVRLKPSLICESVGREANAVSLGRTLVGFAWVKHSPLDQTFWDWGCHVTAAGQRRAPWLPALPETYGTGERQLPLERHQLLLGWPGNLQVSLWRLHQAEVCHSQAFILGQISLDPSLTSWTTLFKLLTILTPFWSCCTLSCIWHRMPFP